MEIKILKIQFMKTKQEPVSRFDISWYTWTKILFTVCFLDFLTWLIVSAELRAVF